MLPDGLDCFNLYRLDLLGDPEANAVNKICSLGLFFAALLGASEAVRKAMKIRECDARRIRTMTIASLVLAWYSVSITLILFNKWALTAWRGGLPCPIFFTMTHMVTKGLLASGYYWLVKFKSLPRLRWQAFCGLSFAGAFAALDIMTSNLSFIFISASFYTFLKSSSLIIILVLTTATCMEPCSVSICATVAFVSAGMFLASYGETNFVLYGFLLVMASEVFASLRWVATQVMVQQERVDAMTSVLYMAPASTLALVPFVLARETHEIRAFFAVDFPPSTALTFIVPGILSFLLLLVEVQLIKETSSLTLTVFGNLKSVMTVIFAMVVFGERTTPLQWVGLVMALTGMVAYSHARGEWLAEDVLYTLQDRVGTQKDMPIVGHDHGDDDASYGTKDARDSRGSAA